MGYNNNNASSEINGTILVADDNVDMLEYVTRILSEKYNIIPVPDGLVALGIEKENFHLSHFFTFSLFQFR